MTREDTQKNFTRVSVGEKEQSDIDVLNREFRRLTDYIFDLCPEGRLKSIAMTKLEECSMFATKSITHNT
jgi:hypothetical protein